MCDLSDLRQVAEGLAAPKLGIAANAKERHRARNLVRGGERTVDHLTADLPLA